MTGPNLLENNITEIETAIYAAQFVKALAAYPACPVDYLPDMDVMERIDKWNFAAGVVARAEAQEVVKVYRKVMIQARNGGCND